VFLKQIMADALVVIKLLTVIYRVPPVLHFSVSKDCNDIALSERDFMLLSSRAVHIEQYAFIKKASFLLLITKVGFSRLNYFIVLTKEIVNFIKFNQESIYYQYLLL